MLRLLLGWAHTLLLHYHSPHQAYVCSNVSVWFALMAYTSAPPNTARSASGPATAAAAGSSSKPHKLSNQVVAHARTVRRSITGGSQ
jgi:hypothetical protein